MTLAEALFKDTSYITLHAYDLTIQSCDDCKVCHHKPTCKYNQDDLRVVLEHLEHCETLIIVSPVYFGAMSDKLLSIINRFQQLFEQKFTHKIKRPPLTNLYVVSTAGADNERMFEGIKLTTSILSSLFDAKIAKVFTFQGSDGIKNPLKHYQTQLSIYRNQR